VVPDFAGMTKMVGLICSLRSTGVVCEPIRELKERA
jgi:hypothetical protein